MGGFYKGNFLGLIYQNTQQLLKLSFSFSLYKYLQDDKSLFYIIRKFGILFGMNTFIDLALHPIHLFQSRIILQHKNKKLRVWPTFKDMVKETYLRREIWNGATLNIPINFFLAFSQIAFMENNKSPSMVFHVLSSLILTYPFLTLMRRKMCQSSKRGMLPISNINKNAYSKYESFFNLYRGFSGFSFVHISIFGLGALLNQINPVFFSNDSEKNIH